LEDFIRLENVRKTYVMGEVEIHAVNDVSVPIGKGEFVIILGASGAGKSTILNLLGGMDQATSGRIFVDGFEISSYNTKQLTKFRREEIGFVFQFYYLLPELNVLENVLITRMVGTKTLGWWRGGSAAARADALRILTRVGMHERLKHRPNERSGGERPRVALARALVHKPRVLFADEPTGNLDAEAGRKIMDLLKELHHEGQTIVMGTHDSGVARYADRVLLLADGRLQPASV